MRHEADLKRPNQLKSSAFFIQHTLNPARRNLKHILKINPITEQVHMEFQSHSCPFIIFTPQLMIASAKLLLISCTQLITYGAANQGIKKKSFLFFLLKQNDQLFREMERAASFKLDMGHRLLTNHAYRNDDIKLMRHVQYKH